MAIGTIDFFSVSTEKKEEEVCSELLISQEIEKINIFEANNKEIIEPIDQEMPQINKVIESAPGLVEENVLKEKNETLKQDTEQKCDDGWKERQLKEQVEADTAYADKKDIVPDVTAKQLPQTKKIITIGMNYFYSFIQDFVCFTGDYLRYRALVSSFKKGRQVESDEYTFLQRSNELMVYRYKGACSVARIPSYVGNIPVHYLHSDVFSKKFSLLDNFKVRRIKDLITTKGLVDYTKDKEGIENSFSLTEIILPNTLVAVFNDTFSGIKGVKRLVLPAGLNYVSPNAFSKTTFALFFNGKAPSGFKETDLSGNVNINVHKEFIKSFSSSK